MQHYRLNEMITTAGLPVRAEYRPADVAKIIGCSMSTLYRLVRDGQITPRRLRGADGHYRISHAAISEYLTCSTQQE